MLAGWHSRGAGGIGGAAPGGGLVLVGSKVVTTSGESSAWSTSLTDLTGGIDTEPSNGDLVLVFYGNTFTSGFSVPSVTTSGYTQITGFFGNSQSRDTYALFYSKRMGATPDITVDLSGTNNNQAGVIVFVYRGVDEATPMDVAATANARTNSSTVNPPSITPITTGAIVLSFGCSASSAGFTSPDLSDFITASETITSVGAGSYDWSSGAFDPAAWTGGSDLRFLSGGAVTVALRPA
jgi:hypothetical protein